jgi:hypothetical protein
MLLLIALFTFILGPANTSFTTVNQVPATTRPGLLAPYTDPVFGTTIIRVTGPTADQKGFRPEYTRLPAINANNQKAVVMGRTNGDYFILDLAGGTTVKVPGIPCGEDPSIVWHRTNPDLLVYFCRNEIRTFQVSNQKTTVMLTLPQYTRIRTKEEGLLSDDWTFGAFFAEKPDGTKEAITVDVIRKNVLAIKPGLASGNWIGSSPSGKYAVIQHGGTTGTRVYDRLLNHLHTLHPDFAHEDFAFDSDGEEVMVWLAKTGPQTQPFQGKSYVIKGRLSDGNVTTILDTKWKWGGHVSGVGSRGRPGWVLVSDYKNIAVHDSPFQNEVFWLKLDGTKVERVAHLRSVVRITNNVKDYYAEPHPVASWDGSLIIFTSNWGETGRYDTYLITGAGPIPAPVPTPTPTPTPTPVPTPPPAPLPPCCRICPTEPVK